MNQYLSVIVNPAQTPRQQILAALAGVPARPCRFHPDAREEVDQRAVIENFLAFKGEVARQMNPETGQEEIAYDWGNELRHQHNFMAFFKRCDSCPYNRAELPDRAHVRGTHWLCPARNIAERSAPIAPAPQLMTVRGKVPMQLDQTAEQQLQVWAAQLDHVNCAFHGSAIPLPLDHCELADPLTTYELSLHYRQCPQCWLEGKGIPPRDATASFENFVADPPLLREHLETCRRFAANPRGTLLMLGHNGNGKTHLALAIMRERFRLGFPHAFFTKHRNFLARHREDQRPVAFDEEPPRTIMSRCHETHLLVMDDIHDPVGFQDAEGPMLDLFEHRIGHSRPSIITANLTPAELEAAIGSRMVDRLRLSLFALLEFNFPSRRPILNAEYLKHRPR